jgi:malonate decarboxylase epsilon subunit
MSILFTFPGQGAQRAGMLHALPDHPEVMRTLEETESALGRNPLLLDSAEALQSTRAVQLSLLISGVAMARVLIAKGSGPDMVAGLSIGAYPAAVIAGVLDYGDAVRLVQLRAQLMEDAYPTGYGMAAIQGLDQSSLTPLLESIHVAHCPVYLANLNGPRQMVISGADPALQQMMALALASGATKAERLMVAVPSHCPLFDAQAEQVRSAFAACTLARPKLTYLSASAARPLFDCARIADDLANNMARQVHWHDTAQLAWERGARLALEMPSGSVLTNLCAPLFAGGLAIACDSTQLDTMIALIGRERR